MTHLPHVMVDVETLGRRDGDAIIQIGAVRFDWRVHDDAPEGWVSSPYGEFRRNVAWDSAGFGNIEPETVQWWLVQCAQTRCQVFAQYEAQELSRVLRDFNQWVHHGGEVAGIWADLPSFDMRLIRQACERTGVPYYFSHSQERDLRTLAKELGVDGDEPLRVGKKNDALDDAHHQARHVVRIMQRLHSTNNS